MEMCQVCGLAKDNHEGEKLLFCKKILKERNKHTLSWLRFRKIGDLIEKYCELSSVALAERLVEEGIKTSFWTIERTRKEILELNPLIGWDSNMKLFYLKRNSSLSQNKGEITSTEATTTDRTVSNLLTKDSAYLN